MLKKLFLMLLIATPLSIYAQDKIAYINSQEIFYKMPEMKDVETKLAAKQEQIKKNAAAIQDEYQKKYEGFKNDTTIPTQSVLEDRQRQLQQLEERYQNFIQSSENEFKKEQETLIAPLHQKMTKVIKEVGDENRYTLIIDSGALLYTGTSAVDASSKVKVKLNITD